MNFDFFMPVRLISGENVVRGNSEAICLGKKAFIVTGKRSARASGALDDVVSALGEHGVEYEVFDRITENPPLSVCFDGGTLARECGADFVIAIGGGSPMDSGKAVAVFAANPEYRPDDIFKGDFKNALPIVTIPTTAGTGSEADPTGVLTLDGGMLKKSFGNALTYPKVSFLDPKYTDSLNLNYTVSTALDALCHCVESYLSPKSTDISRLFARDGSVRLYHALAELSGISDDDSALTRMKPLRYDLMYGACEGGIAISRTGTGFNHPLGYNLTLYRGIPHGRACGAFMKEYFAYNYSTDEGKRLFDALGKAIGAAPSEISENVVRWADVRIGAKYGNGLTDSEIDEYISNVSGARNYKNSPYVINVEEMRAIYKRLFA